jgi:hypothetical protein
MLVLGLCVSVLNGKNKMVGVVIYQLYWNPVLLVGDFVEELKQ